MIVKTLFQNDGGLAPGEVEIQLMPGLPLLQVVGLPDSHIKECGLRLKSALRSCDLKWPKGHQIVVNLRPSYFRKSSSGVELAIALGFLAETGQLNEAVKEELSRSTVYGEIGLDGRVFAPGDFPQALRNSPQPLITGAGTDRIPHGQWKQISTLKADTLSSVRKSFDWNRFWLAPEVPDLELPESAFQALLLSAHMGLNVLIAGPQGSGKSTWARLAHAISPPPDLKILEESRTYFGDEIFESRWRPLESPHHSITPLAMVGGGAPLFPGVISRAHGGILIMDEFLQFSPEVLEALREPVESGFIEHARRGERRRFPARFQLIGTTNLCPCGKLSPMEWNANLRRRACSRTLVNCRSVCRRLSGPIMDRFDLLLFSHDWLNARTRRSTSELRPTMQRMREFARGRGARPARLSPGFSRMGYSHRRGQAILKLARGLADLEQSAEIQREHYLAAATWAVEPLDKIAALFA